MLSLITQRDNLFKDSKAMPSLPFNLSNLVEIIVDSFKKLINICIPSILNINSLLTYCSVVRSALLLTYSSALVPKALTTRALLCATSPALLLRALLALGLARSL